MQGLLLMCPLSVRGSVREDIHFGLTLLLGHYYYKFYQSILTQNYFSIRTQNLIIVE